MNKLKLFWTWITKDMKRIIGAVVLVILMVIGIWKLTSGNGNEVTYQTSKVEKGTIVSSVSASGQVLTTNILSINTEASGVVKKVYVKDGDEVYAGQVVGNSSKGEDMYVNPTKGKQLTNMRASGTDEALNLVPPFTLTIERGLEVMADDEYLEITPTSVRLRKQFLTESARVKANNKK